MEDKKDNFKGKWGFTSDVRNGCCVEFKDSQFELDFDWDGCDDSWGGNL